ncbi:folate-dependent protein for Fe/S cluster synthesis/repair in oxidative stress [Salinisphaera sp. S4-8]
MHFMTDSASLQLSALGAIAVTGADAAEFLRAQLTNDVLRLGRDRHLLAAWCDAKGRAQMIARVCETDDGYLLIVPEELIDGLLKRLQMFVLRAAVELRDCRDTLRISARHAADLPAAGAAHWQNDVVQLGLAPAVDGGARALEIAPAAHPAPADAMATNDPRWLREEVDAGLPNLVAATQGLFVPQMLNLHWLEAIDFDKGCYPGQEVIARLHYRGTLTRRMFRLFWHGELPAPGSDVLDADGARAGTVLYGTEGPHSGQGVLLAVLKTSAANASLATAQATLEPGELPYPTPE